MKSKRYSFIGWLVVFACTANVNNLVAQDTATANIKWRFLIEPYMMFPNMNGTIGLGNLPDAEVDQDPGDIFSNLKMAAMLYVEANKGSWTISSDFTYMKLGSGVEGKRGILSGDANAEQLAWELAALYKLKPWLDAGLAFQLNNIKSDLNLLINLPGGPQTRSRGMSQSWVDPSVIARVKLPLSQKWSFLFRGNVGGVGIGSDFYWQVQSYFAYRFSKLFQLSAGYRVISMDYENGSGSDRFLYDMNTFGPVLRLGFTL